MAKTFRLTIHTENEAFTSGPAGCERNAETARILRDVANALDQGAEYCYYVTLRDINGNDVGRAAFKE